MHDGLAVEVEVPVLEVKDTVEDMVPSSREM